MHRDFNEFDVQMEAIPGPALGAASVAPLPPIPVWLYNRIGIPTRRDG